MNFDWKNPDYEEVYRQRAEALSNIRKHPEYFKALWEYYRINADDFINDWGMTFDPRNAERDLPTTIPFVLFDKQRDFINWVLDRWEEREDGLVEKSRDMGVSWLCVGLAVWMWIFHKGTVIGFGSRKEDLVDKIGDPDSLFWKIRTFIDFLPPEFKPKGYDPDKHAPYMRIINPENNSVIKGEAGKNIGRGGRTSIYFKDESAFYEQPEVIDAALSQTSNCKIDVSTPNGAGNPFYRKRHGGRIPVFIFDWRDDPRKGEDWYRRMCETLDPVIVAQEIDRNYEASVSNAFIDGEIVDAAARRGVANTIPQGRLRVGVDVARFGDDKTVITIRRGSAVLKQEELSKADVVEVASRVHREIQAYGEVPEQIAVDTIGIGAGVADILRSWYPDRMKGGRVVKIVRDVNSSERMSNGLDYNLRAFMWREMREWLKSGSIPNDPKLRTDLTALRYTYRGGMLLLEDKQEAKKRGVKSPDYGDSLALTFAYPSVGSVSVANRRTVAATPFDPEIGV